MKTYLIFFGSSDGFEFVAFDISSGDCEEFKSRFKNFDQLDPKFIITDNVDNKPIFGKYRFNFNGISLSLLKTYQCAQSNVSSRIAGSNIGIALISERDLAFNLTNIDLLNEIRNEFSQLALNGYRFKEKKFTKIAEQLFEKFKSDLSIINFDPNKLTSDNLAGNSVFVSSDVNEQITRIVNDSSIKYSRFYLCSDLEHAVRSMQAKSFHLFVKHNNDFIPYKDFLEVIKPPKQENNKLKTGVSSNLVNQQTEVVRITSSDSKDFEHEIRKLEDRILKANRHIEKLSNKNKKMSSMLVLCIVFFFGFLCYYYLGEKKIKSEKIIIDKEIIINPLKDLLNKKDTSEIDQVREYLLKCSKNIKEGKKIDSISPIPDSFR